MGISRPRWGAAREGSGRRSTRAASAVSAVRTTSCLRFETIGTRTTSHAPASAAKISELGTSRPYPVRHPELSGIELAITVAITTIRMPEARRDDRARLGTTHRTRRRDTRERRLRVVGVAGADQA